MTAAFPLATSAALAAFIKSPAVTSSNLTTSLISSKDLSQQELDNISKDLSDSTGSIIKFDYKFDKKLIGGLKLQLGSIMIDTSIKSKLKKYEQAMIEN